jgi:cell division protein FtsA
MVANSTNMIVALDIGTSKVVAMVGERSDNGVIEVIGIGTQRSRGLKKGWWSTSSRPCSRSSAPSKRPS